MLCAEEVSLRLRSLKCVISSFVWSLSAVVKLRRIRACVQVEAMATCDGCHETFSKQEARCTLNFNLCGPCHRKTGDVPPLHLPFAYRCFTPEYEGQPVSVNALLHY